MASWDFFDYVNSIGTNPVAKWFRKNLSIQEQSDLEALLKILQRTAVWVSPDYETLKGKYQGLGEIRLKGDARVPMRLIGYRDQDPRILKFTFLIGCFHKDRVYIPADALDTALRRKKDLDNSRGTTCEHEFEGDDEAEKE